MRIHDTIQGTKRMKCQTGTLSLIANGGRGNPELSSMLWISRRTLMGKNANFTTTIWKVTEQIQLLDFQTIRLFELEDATVRSSQIQAISSKAQQPKSVCNAIGKVAEQMTRIRLTRLQTGIVTINVVFYISQRKYHPIL